LWEYELKLIAADQFECRAGLRADADPVQSSGSLLSSIGLDCDLEPSGMKCLDSG
jgi:hypothetical protein